MPTEFRQEVIDLARRGGSPLAQIAKDFGLSVTTLKRWMALPIFRTPGPDRQWPSRRRYGSRGSEAVCWSRRVCAGPPLIC
jgi:transposase